MAFFYRSSEVVETSRVKHIKGCCNCDCIVRPTGVKTNEARSLIQTRPKDINRVKLLLLPLLCLLRRGVERLKFFETELINLN